MIATWYSIVSFMLIVYIVLDGRSFGEISPLQSSNRCAYLHESHRTLRDGSLGWRCPRHFVPGYDRTVPPGHFATASMLVGIEGNWHHGTMICYSQTTFQTSSEPSAHRTTVETIKALAGMVRFVIVDLTDDYGPHRTPILGRPSSSRCRRAPKGQAAESWRRWALRRSVHGPRSNRTSVTPGL